MIQVTQVRTAHGPVYLDTMDVGVLNVVPVPRMNTVNRQEGVCVTQPVETVSMQVFNIQVLSVYIEI